MLEKIRRYVEKWHMIENGDKIIVGVSGGADSICLLFVLIQLQKEIPFELVCVHVNHGLRGIDADADEMYVKKMCEKHCVPCEIYREDVALIAKKRKQSLEEAGREVRREAFVKTLKRYGGTKIALAHHQNDNAETFLMNVARGAGLKGLGGIRPVNGNVIRPLLAVERGEVEKYLEEEGIAFCVDETNKSDAYMRNRIRNHILPYFEEQVNKRTVTHINETMERLREIEGFLEEQTEISWRQCARTEETGTVILQAEFQQIPHVIQSFVLKKVLWEVCRREKDIEAVHLQMLQELFEKQVGRRVDLPYDMEAWRTYDGVVCRKKTEPEPQKAEEKILDCEGQETHLCEWCGWQIKSRVFVADQVPQEASEKVYTKWFDYDIIRDAVSIRTRKPGDYLAIHSDGKTQKLKSYFINEKISAEERGKIPLIAEGSHILWVVGYRTSSAYRVTKNTKTILEIQINEGEESWQRQLKY